MSTVTTQTIMNDQLAAQQLQQQYQQDLAYSNTIANSGERLMYMTTTMMSLVGQYTQVLELITFDTMNALSEMTNDVSDLQAQYNDIGELSSNGYDQPADMGTYVDPAIDDAVAMMNLLFAPLAPGATNPFATINQNCLDNLNTIFGANNTWYTQNSDGTYSADYSDDQQIGTYWWNSWDQATKTSTGSYTDNTSGTPITNAFNGLQSTVSGLNNATATEQQQYQSMSQQYYSSQESDMQTEASQNNVIVNNQKSS